MARRGRERRPFRPVAERPGCRCAQSRPWSTGRAARARYRSRAGRARTAPAQRCAAGPGRPLRPRGATRLGRRRVAFRRRRAQPGGGRHAGRVRRPQPDAALVRPVRSRGHPPRRGVSGLRCRARGCDRLHAAARGGVALRASRGRPALPARCNRRPGGARARARRERARGRVGRERHLLRRHRRIRAAPRRHRGAARAHRLAAGQAAAGRCPCSRRRLRAALASTSSKALTARGPRSARS